MIDFGIDYYKTLMKLQRRATFLKSLTKPTKIQDILFSDNCQFLNCRSFEQYKNTYINFFVVGCLTKSEIQTVTDLLNSFRILHHQSNSVKELKDLEKDSKKEILFQVIANLSNKNQLKEFVKERASIIDLM